MPLTIAALEDVISPPAGEEREFKSLPERVILLLFVIGPLILIPLAGAWLCQPTVLDLSLLISFYLLTGQGITMGYHRMLTHSSFQAYPAVKFVLLGLGSMAVEGAADEWARTHREHHHHADRKGDPHSPREGGIKGFLFAHITWMLYKHPSSSNASNADLLNDRVVSFISKSFLLWVVLSLVVIPFGIDGVHGIIWGGIIRMCLTHHITWSVNSVCHVFGKRPFRTGDLSTNNWLVGLLAGGEGWHNNHHAFQRSAFHGLFWWQFDLSGYIIRLLEKLKMIWDVQRVDMSKIAAKMVKIM